MTRRNAGMVMAVMLSAFFIAGLISLPLPFTRDQGIYAYNAYRWLGDNVLYKEVFDHKGPLLYLVYALSLKFSAGAMWGPNLADLLSRTLTVALTYLLAAGLVNRRTGLISALCCALPLFGVFNSVWWNAQAETFMMPLLAGSALLASSNKKAPFLIAGVVASQAMFLKISALPHLIFLLLWALSQKDKRWQLGAIIIAGMVAGASPWIAYLAVTGALVPMFELVVVFNSFHAAAAIDQAGLPAAGILWKRFVTVFQALPLALLAIPAAANRHDKKWAVVFAGLWLLFSALQVIMQGRFFLYHFLVMVPPMAVIAGIGIETAYEAALCRNKIAARWSLAALLTMAALSYSWYYYLLERSYRTSDYLRSRITLAEYYSRFSEDNEKGMGDFNLLASVAVAHRLRETTPEGSTALIFGYEPLINYLAARPAPTRFEIDYPLTFKPRNSRAQRFRQRFRTEFMEDLNSSPPDVIILVDNDQNAIELEPSIIQAEEFKEFFNWIKERYWTAETIEDFHFYRLKE